ncbi:MAG TPA: hypothetical protein VHC20_01610 [Candidatus Paceibacterota bacterium]|nr:hypothetical protein [Candidatus Paceibacterota bacterium]
MTATAIAVLGLSDAGKSTWLGSLCDVLETAPAERLTSLEFDGLPDMFRELRSLRDVLNKGAYPRHTVFSHNSNLSFPLRWKLDGEEKSIILDVSDYSGERVARLYDKELHTWDAGWEERASRTRIALLLRADDIRRLARRTETKASLGVQLIAAEHLPVDSTAERHPPTALALIEAMQAMRAWRGVGVGRRSEPSSERVAVLLTAWDKVNDASRRAGPTAFLEKNAPLLAAWLRSNIRPDDMRVYGLSATGGDLGDPLHSKRVQEVGIASVAYVEMGSPPQQHKDVALPLEWLLSGRP